MTLAKKVIDAYDEDSLNSLGQLPKKPIKSKKKNRKALIVQVQENYIIDSRKLLKGLPKSDLEKKYVTDHQAMTMIVAEIGNMAWEINASEAGKRQGRQMLNKETGAGYLKYVNLSTTSTFPKYLQQIYNDRGTKDKFMASVRKGSGKYFNAIAKEAVSRLENGYQNLHGYDEPNADFLELVDNPVPF